MKTEIERAREDIKEYRKGYGQPQLPTDCIIQLMMGHADKQLNLARVVLPKGTLCAHTNWHFAGFNGIPRKQCDECLKRYDRIKSQEKRWASKRIQIFNSRLERLKSYCTGAEWAFLYTNKRGVCNEREETTLYFYFDNIHNYPRRPASRHDQVQKPC